MQWYLLYLYKMLAQTIISLNVLSHATFVLLVSSFHKFVLMTHHYIHELISSCLHHILAGEMNGTTTKYQNYYKMMIIPTPY